jgi:hypothetical protein
MIASRLLGLGKEKFPRAADIAYCDLLPEESDELESADTLDTNPFDHALEAVVKRYLKITLAKETTKLGGSDWSQRELSEKHRAYMLEDVRHLPPLWDVLKAELSRAGLSRALRCGWN